MYKIDITHAKCGENELMQQKKYHVFHTDLQPFCCLRKEEDVVKDVKEFQEQDICLKNIGLKSKMS